MRLIVPLLKSEKQAELQKTILLEEAEKIKEKRDELISHHLSKPIFFF